MCATPMLRVQNRLAGNAAQTAGPASDRIRQLLAQASCPDTVEGCEVSSSAGLEGAERCGVDSAACSTMQHIFAAAHYRAGRRPAVEPIRWDPSSPIHRSKTVASGRLGVGGSARRRLGRRAMGPAGAPDSGPSEELPEEQRDRSPCVFRRADREPDFSGCLLKVKGEERAARLLLPDHLADSARGFEPVPKLEHKATPLKSQQRIPRQFGDPGQAGIVVAWCQRTADWWSL
jgi:hypothetical protein